MKSPGVTWVLTGAWVSAGLTAGCVADGAGRRPSAADRQSAALNDPFGYGPTAQTIGGVQARDRGGAGGGAGGPFEPRQAGGRWNELDRDGLRRDLDRVFNP